AAGSVHPHACGERIILSFSMDSGCGSSPRMWGTGLGWWAARRGIRFIPTHVGNGSIPRQARHGTTVHPHACGERLDDGGSWNLGAGSSPRMWGTAGTPIPGYGLFRFIPTHVGNGP